MSIPLSKSNKGWHKLWFYLKNDNDAPLPIFTGRLIEQVLGVWRYGPIEKEQKRLDNLLKAIVTLKGHGLCRRHRRSIPRQEAGTADGARSSDVQDDARFYARRDGDGRR